MMKCFIKNRSGNFSAAGAIVALMLTIIIGIMVFFTVSDDIAVLSGETTEYFSGYALKTQLSSTFSVTLDASTNYDNCNISFYNGTLKNVVGYPGDAQKYFINNTVLTILGGCSSNQFSQINVTYTPLASIDGVSTKDMAGTVFTLLPIVALVMIASIILAVVIGFGGSGKNGI